MKFVLVIDVADDVVEAYEDFTVDYDFRGTPKEDRMVNESIKYIEDAEPRPLPQKVEMDLNEYYEGMADGWNACIEKIIDYGGKQNDTSVLNHKPKRI